MFPYSQANTRIKNHIIRKGFQLRELMRFDEMKPYVGLALNSLSVILFNL